MRAPCIHLNGTTRAELQARIREALAASRLALTSISLMAPNKRDYYPLGEDAWLEARRQHDAMTDQQVAIIKELEDLLEAIAE